jgi:hypothetical protein
MNVLVSFALCMVNIHPFYSPLPTHPLSLSLSLFFSLSRPVLSSPLLQLFLVLLCLPLSM